MFGSSTQLNDCLLLRIAGGVQLAFVSLLFRSISPQSCLFGPRCDDVVCAYKNGWSMFSSSTQSVRLSIFTSHRGWVQLALIPLLFCSTRGNSAANLVDLTAGLINSHWFPPPLFLLWERRIFCNELLNRPPPLSFVRWKGVSLSCLSKIHHILAIHDSIRQLYTVQKIMSCLTHIGSRPSSHCYTSCSQDNDISSLPPFPYYPIIPLFVFKTKSQPMSIFSPLVRNICIWWTNYNCQNKIHPVHHQLDVEILSDAVIPDVISYSGWETQSQHHSKVLVLKIQASATLALLTLILTDKVCQKSTPKAIHTILKKIFFF